MQEGEVPSAMMTTRPEHCVAPYDLQTSNRTDVPGNVQQLMIVTGGTAFVQGQLYTGEMHSNTMALIDSVNGKVLFILKVQDSASMPTE